MILSTKENSWSCKVTSGLALSADKSYIDCDAVVNMEKKNPQNLRPPAHSEYSFTPEHQDEM